MYPLYSCCTSRITRLPTCTHPLTQNTQYEEEEFCPSPPQTSLQDLVNNSTVGPLDTYTAYVDEVLMRLSHDITAPVFTRRVVGGFVLQHRRDPSYTVCACNSTDVVCNNFFGSLQLCQHDIGRPTYLAPLSDLHMIQNSSCTDLDFRNFKNERNESGEGVSGEGDLQEERGCDSLDFQPGYEVDGLGAGLLQTGACDCHGLECNEEREKCLVSTQYHQEMVETLSVTVWYNSRVSVTVHVHGCVGRVA